MSDLPRRLWRRLPEPLRRRVWWGLDRLGAWPVTIGGGPARGLEIYAPASRRRGYRAGSQERALLELLEERLEPGMEVVDAGAFLGWVTLAAAARVGAGGRVWAFEPRAASRALLERSCRRNRLRQVTVVPAALGARAGAGLLATPANPAMARLAPPPGSGNEPVEVTTLDAWRETSLARPALIKLDVEGAELDVLRGAGATLRALRPLLVVEVHRGGGIDLDPEELGDWLRAAGYRPRPLGPRPEGEAGPMLRRLAAVPPSAPRVHTVQLVAAHAGERDTIERGRSAI